MGGGLDLHHPEHKPAHSEDHPMMRHSPQSPVYKKKMKKVMHEFKGGTLHSGSKTGPVVTSRKQAVRIGMSEAERETKKKRKR